MNKEMDNERILPDLVNQSLDQWLKEWAVICEPGEGEQLQIRKAILSSSSEEVYGTWQEAFPVIAEEEMEFLCKTEDVVASLSLPFFSATIPDWLKLLLTNSYNTFYLKVA